MHCKYICHSPFYMFATATYMHCKYTCRSPFYIRVRQQPTCTANISAIHLSICVCDSNLHALQIYLPFTSLYMCVTATYMHCKFTCHSPLYICVRQQPTCTANPAIHLSIYVCDLLHPLIATARPSFHLRDSLSRVRDVLIS